MNFINKKRKYKSGLRLLILLAGGGVLGACGYDPPEGVPLRTVESQSNDVGIDLVVPDRLVLKSSPGKIRRLVLLEGAVLSTDGYNLKLEIEELVSFGGTISTTPISRSSETERRGRSGGELQILAQKGQGRLRIISGGQDGVSGAKRVKATKSKRARAGAPGGNGGDSSAVLFVMIDAADFLVSTEVQPGKGGIGDPVGKDGVERPFCMRLGKASIGECRDFQEMTR